MVNDDNAVTAVAEAVAKLGRHQFPIVVHRRGRRFPDRGGRGDRLLRSTPIPRPRRHDRQTRPIARIVGATLRDTANPTMLKAGYKANVIPATAEAVLDCRVLPGRQEAFEREVDEIIGPDIAREWVTELAFLRNDFRR